MMNSSLNQNQTIQILVIYMYYFYYFLRFNAFSLWHHFESKTRGYEDTPEKLERFNNEIKKFQEKWPDILKNGDPFHNINFNLDKGPFKLY